MIYKMLGFVFILTYPHLHNVMEACAENNIPLIVLDRPNPNAHYIDGPVLNIEHKSFVGMHPVPIVYGMTIGEYAQMINGEKWLANSIKCDLTSNSTSKLHPSNTLRINHTTITQPTQRNNLSHYIQVYVC